MKGFKYVVVLVLLVFFVFSYFNTILAEELGVLEKTLTGIKNVSLFISEPHPDVINAGLTKSEIQNIVELKLRLAGIGITEYPGADAVIQVIFSTIKLDTRPSFVYRYGISVLQDAHLIRNPKIIAFNAETWLSEGYLGIVSRDEVESTIKEGMREQMDQFLNAYLKANPK